MPRGARWVSYGRLSQQAPALTQMGQFIFMKKRIEGFWLSSWLRGTAPDRVAAVVQEVQARFADGRWHTDISATVSLADALEQLPGEYAKKNAKVLLAP